MVGRIMLKIIRPKKQAKFQWLQDASEMNGDNMNYMRSHPAFYEKKAGISIGKN
jgi:hypothetical protein